MCMRTLGRCTSVPGEGGGATSKRFEKGREKLVRDEDEAEEVEEEESEDLLSAEVLDTMGPPGAGEAKEDDSIAVATAVVGEASEAMAEGIGGGDVFDTSPTGSGGGGGGSGALRWRVTVRRRRMTRRSTSVSMRSAAVRGRRMPRGTLDIKD